MLGENKKGKEKSCEGLVETLYRKITKGSAPSRASLFRERSREESARNARDRQRPRHVERVSRRGTVIYGERKLPGSIRIPCRRTDLQNVICEKLERPSNPEAPKFLPSLRDILRRSLPFKSSMRTNAKVERNQIK